MGKEFKSGFVSIIGRPNVGKSTLLNHMVGSKIAIMSDKPQTTRNKITGVLTREEAQVVFIDTPGIHKPKNKLGEYMVNSTMATLEEVDLVLYLVDAAAEISIGEFFIIDILKKLSTPVFLVVNKIDLVAKKRIAELIHFLTLEFDFGEVVPVSAATGENTEVLLKLIVDYLPKGPKYYPEDMITDKPEQFIIAEIVREKVLETTREEVPHSTAVQVEEIKNRKDNMVYISAIIYIEKHSQKGIVVGKGGQKLKEIGIKSRRELERLLGSRIYLDLWVKVKKDWRRHEGALDQFGYSFKNKYG